MPRRIVVIGGGPAAVASALEAKKKDATADVTLVTDEACEPYEKPPLSKGVLLGKVQPEDAPIAGPGGLARNGVALQLKTRCLAINRAAHHVVTASGALPYDALVIATGSVMRNLPLLPMRTPRVHYLRTATDARAIKANLAACKRLVVIGAGLIGLEVAAAAAELGIGVTIIDSAPRIMTRACDEATSAIIQAEHRTRGVIFALSTSITHVCAGDNGCIILKSSEDEAFAADLVVVGVGVKPDHELGSNAGLTVQDGIVVDAQCRTSDPNVFAAGDVACFPTPQGVVRLENWRHAQDQGAIAGRNAAGGDESYQTVPSFWSEQYDLYIQGVGWPDAAAMQVRRKLSGKSALLLEMKGGGISYALGINAQRDLSAIRRLIERKIPVDPEFLADPAKPFAAMLKVNS